MIALDQLRQYLPRRSIRRARRLLWRRRIHDNATAIISISSTGALFGTLAGLMWFVSTGCLLSFFVVPSFALANHEPYFWSTSLIATLVPLLLISTLLGLLVGWRFTISAARYCIARYTAPSSYLLYRSLVTLGLLALYHLPMCLWLMEEGDLEDRGEWITILLVLCFVIALPALITMSSRGAHRLSLSFNSLGGKLAWLTAYATVLPIVSLALVWLNARLIVPRNFVYVWSLLVILGDICLISFFTLVCSISILNLASIKEVTAQIEKKRLPKGLICGMLALAVSVPIYAIHTNINLWDSVPLFGTPTLGSIGVTSCKEQTLEIPVQLGPGWPDSDFFEISIDRAEASLAQKPLLIEAHSRPFDTPVLIATANYRRRMNEDDTIIVPWQTNALSLAATNPHRDPEIENLTVALTVRCASTPQREIVLTEHNHTSTLVAIELTPRDGGTTWSGKLQGTVSDHRADHEAFVDLEILEYQPAVTSTDLARRLYTDAISQGSLAPFTFVDTPFFVTYSDDFSAWRVISRTVDKDGKWEIPVQIKETTTTKELMEESKRPITIFARVAVRRLSSGTDLVAPDAVEFDSSP